MARPDQHLGDSDHGFSTHTGAVDLDVLLEPFNGTLDDGTPRIVAGGGAIYVRDEDPEAVAAIVGELQRSPRVGAIFTPALTPGSFDGSVPGTLSCDLGVVEVSMPSIDGRG